MCEAVNLDVGDRCGIAKVFANIDVDCYTNDEYLVSDCFTTKHISGNVYACSTLKLILHIDGSQIQY